jgi:hypothetical protein
MEKLANSDSRFPVYRINFSWEITLFKASLLFTLISLAVAIFFGDFFIERNKQYGLKIILFLAGASSALALESLVQPKSKREDRSRLNSLPSSEIPSTIYIESLNIASPEKEESKSVSIRQNDEPKKEPSASPTDQLATKDSQKVTLYLPPQLHKKLKIRSSIDQEPMSSLAEQAISFYLANPETIENIKSGIKEVVVLDQFQQIRSTEEEASEQSGSSTQR